MMLSGSWLIFSWRRQLHQMLFQEGIYMTSDAAVPLGIGMDAVGLIECRHAANTFQQKREEFKLILMGKVTIHLTKTVGVLVDVVGGQLHACKEHGHASLFGGHN